MKNNIFNNKLPDGYVSYNSLAYLIDKVMVIICSVRLQIILSKIKKDIDDIALLSKISLFTKKDSKILTWTYDGSISIISPKMIKDGTWRGHFELQALSRVLMRNISVYNDNKEYIVIEVSNTVALIQFVLRTIDPSLTITVQNYSKKKMQKT